MATPESKVKVKVKKILASFGVGLWSYWPVPMGIGRKTVDCIGCYRGYFFAIETKAEGKKPTLLQTRELQDIDAAMGKTFVIAGLDDTDELVAWLGMVTGSTPYDPRISPDQTNRRPI